MQSLKSTDWFKNIKYLDGNFLILKNGWLDNSASFTLASHKYNIPEIGKWQLVCESSSETKDKLQTEKLA